MSWSCWRLTRRDFGADADESAVERTPLADLQPPSVRERGLDAPRVRGVAGAEILLDRDERRIGFRHDIAIAAADGARPRRTGR